MLVMTTFSVSAATNYYPMPSSSYGTSSSYSETPGFTITPSRQSSSNSNSNYLNQNFDSSNYAYDYRGPMFERTSTYSDNLLIDKSSHSGFFTSNSNNIFHRSINSKVVEKYVGATESLYINRQNRQVSTSNTNKNAASNYNNGMTWGKARLYDSSEYADSGYNHYYYRPLYDSSTGGFNWRY